jgi:hypothetical protein
VSSLCLCCLCCLGSLCLSLALLFAFLFSAFTSPCYVLSSPPACSSLTLADRMFLFLVVAAAVFADARLLTESTRGAPHGDHDDHDDHGCGSAPRTYSGSFSYDIDPPGHGAIPTLNQDFGYTGHGTVSDPELGAFTETGTYRILSFVNGIGHVTGRGVQTFAHGTLTYTFDEVIDYTQAPATVHTVNPGTFRIVEGTQAFRGATGSGSIVTASGYIDTTTGHLIVVDTYTGTWRR